MDYTEIKADITRMDGYVIAHCISMDCAMGAGVVIPICNKHAGLRNACRSYVKENKMFPGNVFKYADDKGIVYNMFTKEKYWQNAFKGMHPGEYMSNLKAALTEIRMNMLLSNETKLAMPLIACGLDRCNWTEVSSLIKEVFEDTSIEIKVCIWN